MSIIVEGEFPRASELNQSLYDRVCENLQKNVVSIDPLHRIGARRTEFNLHEQKIKEIDELTSWIQHMLPEVSKKFAGKPELYSIPHKFVKDEEYGYNLNSFEIAECWGAHFNKGESVMEHNHFPYILSFTYYVKTPKGTAPIMIEGDPHNVKEGQCIFFLASQYHSVGKNDCDGRCAIVGNILYRRSQNDSME